MKPKENGIASHGRALSDDDLTRLFHEYYPKVYNHIYYRLLAREQTEDLVSEVFVKIVRSYHDYDCRKASLSTWIFHITHNTLIDYYRANKPTASLDEILLEPSTEDEYLGLDDHAARVRELLVYLGDDERELIYLKYFAEKKNSEIAELLDMNVSTVSTRLSRSLAKMRAHAGGGFDE